MSGQQLFAAYLALNGVVPAEFIGGGKACAKAGAIATSPTPRSTAIGGMVDPSWPAA
jgi:hypothetical protein